MVTDASVVKQEIRAGGGSEFAQFKKAFKEFHGGMYVESLEELGSKVLKDLGMTDLTGYVEKLTDKPRPWFKKDDLQNHVFTSMEVKRDISGRQGCDVCVLFDGDRKNLSDPTVAMEARWREAGGRMEMTNATMNFKKRGSTAFGGDFKVWFNPETGQMKGLQVSGDNLKKELRVFIEAEGKRLVGAQGNISFDDNREGFEEACNFLEIHTGLNINDFKDGFEVKRTLAEFIETGTVQERAGVVSPVIVKKAS